MLFRLAEVVRRQIPPISPPGGAPGRPTTGTDTATDTGTDTSTPPVGVPTGPGTTDRSTTGLPTGPPTGITSTSNPLVPTIPSATTITNTAITPTSTSATPVVPTLNTPTQPPTIATSTTLVTAPPAVTNAFTPPSVAPESTSSSIAAASNDSQNLQSKGFFQNKGAVAGVFAVVGLLACVVLIIIVTTCIRKRRARRFDADVAAAAAAAYRDSDGRWDEGGWDEGAHKNYGGAAMVQRGGQFDDRDYHNYGPEQGGPGGPVGHGRYGSDEFPARNASPPPSNRPPPVQDPFNGPDVAALGAGAGVAAGYAQYHNQQPYEQGYGQQQQQHARYRSPPPGSMTSSSGHTYINGNGTGNGHVENGYGVEPYPAYMNGPFGHMTDSIDGGRYPVPPARTKSMRGRNGMLDRARSTSSGHGITSSPSMRGAPQMPVNHQMPMTVEHGDDEDVYGGMAPTHTPPNGYGHQEGGLGEVEDLPRQLRVANY